MSRSLLSERRVTRWFGGSRRNHTPALRRERLLISRIKPLSTDAAAELDELCAEHILDGQEHTLFVVGTLLMRHGHRRLWRRVYRACQVNLVVKKGDELRFLERMTAAAR